MTPSIQSHLNKFYRTFDSIEFGGANPSRQTVSVKLNECENIREIIMNEYNDILVNKAKTNKELVDFAPTLYHTRKSIDDLKTKYNIS